MLDKQILYEHDCQAKVWYNIIEIVRPNLMTSAFIIVKILMFKHTEYVHTYMS